MTTDNSPAGGQAAGATNTQPAGNEPPKNADGTRVDPQAGAQGEFSVPSELVEWGKSKGYDDLEKLAKENPTAYKMATSYRQAEKMLGGDKIILPRDADDADAWNAAYDKLGRPADSAEYDIPLPEGGDAKLSDFMKPLLHKAGVNQQGAQLLAEGFNQFSADVMAEYDRVQGEKASSEKVDLEKEWGSDYKSREEGARRVWSAGMKAIGLDGEASGQMLEALQREMGVKNTMKFMNWVNGFAKTTEDSFEGGAPNSRPGGSLTPGSAQQRKDQMMQDPEIAKKYRSGDHKVRTEINGLNEIIAQGKMVDSH